MMGWEEMRLLNVGLRLAWGVVKHAKKTYIIWAVKTKIAQKEKNKFEQLKFYLLKGHVRITVDVE